MVKKVVCDKCKAEITSEKGYIKINNQEKDLCKSCFDRVKNWLDDKKEEKKDFLGSLMGQ